MKISVYIATSLDGFIARPDGSLDWLPGADGDGIETVGGDDYGYGEFMASVDVLVMGRNTFDTVLGFGDWPYTLPVRVLGTRPIAVPPDLADRVEWMSGTPGEISDALAQQGFGRVYIDGGVTIQRFLRAGWVDRLIITRVPVLIGSGIPLFGELDADTPLQHVATQAFDNGFVQSTYEVTGDMTG